MVEVVEVVYPCYRSDGGKGIQSQPLLQIWWRGGKGIWPAGGRSSHGEAMVGPKRGPEVEGVAPLAGQAWGR